jgi:hypothetical protein
VHRLPAFVGGEGVGDLWSVPRRRVVDDRSAGLDHATQASPEGTAQSVAWHGSAG